MFCPVTSLPALLPLLSLAVSLCVDLSSEGVLQRQGDLVDDPDPRGQQQARRLAVQDGRAQEAARRAPVHGRISDVEGEAGNHVVHQDPEVVAEESPRDAQSPGRADDEDIARSNESIGEILGLGGFEQRVGGLVAQGTLVQEVTDETE